MKRFRFLALGLLLAALFAQPSSALTLSDIRDAIRLRIKDTSVSRERYTDAELNAIINEAQRDINNATWAFIKNDSFSLSSGSTYYALQSDVVVLIRATLNNKVVPEYTIDKLDSDFPGGWQQITGKPIAYFMDPAQPGYIGVYPWPNNSTSTGTIRLLYVAQPPDMSADTDVPFTLTSSVNKYLYPYHDLFVMYGCYRVFLIEGENDKALTYRQEYEARLDTMRGRVGMKPNYNPGIIGGTSPAR